MSGERFVTAGKDLDIRMYDAETNQVKGREQQSKTETWWCGGGGGLLLGGEH